jgi:hypothetical protein
LVQELLKEQVEALRGRVVTLGGWVKAASEPTVVHAPTLYDDFGSYGKVITATQEWRFHAITTTVSLEAKAVQVRLLPYEEEGEGVGAAYYDGVVLVQGEFPTDETPRFDDADANTGMWGGKPFVNLLFNGSGERAWPRLRPWLANRKLARHLSFGRDPSSIFQSAFLDWPRTKWIHRYTMVNLFQSFWARFGWNHVGLTAGWYWALLILTLLGFGGFAVFFIRHYSRYLAPWQRRAISLLLVAFFLVWGSNLIRPHPVLALSLRIVLPVARYAYPLIIPTVMFLFLGLRELTPRRFRRFLPAMCLVGLMLLDTVSWFGTIIPFYYSH